MRLQEKEIMEILMRWRTRISAAVWVVIKDPHLAEDIFQNVVVKALTKNVAFENESALVSWAFVTGRREGLDHLRKRKRETLGLDSELLDLLDHDWVNESAGVSSPRLEALRECVGNLPPRSQNLLERRYFYGEACEAISKRLGIQLNAVYKRISRLHHSLRTCVDAKLGLDAATPESSTP